MKRQAYGFRDRAIFKLKEVGTKTPIQVAAAWHSKSQNRHFKHPKRSLTQRSAYPSYFPLRAQLTHVSLPLLRHFPEENHPLRTPGSLACLTARRNLQRSCVGRQTSRRPERIARHC